MTAQIASDQELNSVVVFFKNDDWGQDYQNRVVGYLETIRIEVTGAIALNDAQPSYRAEVTQGLKGNPDGAVLVLYPIEGAVAVREWLSLGGAQSFVMANSLRSDEFSEAVGLQHLANALGMDNAAPRVDSADAFIDAYVDRFGSQPNGPGISNSYDATMIGLLAYAAAGVAEAREVLAAGGTVMYQGATGNVTFDENGDVSVTSFPERGAFICMHAPHSNLVWSHVFLRKTGNHFCATCSRTTHPAATAPVAGT